MKIKILLCAILTCFLFGCSKSGGDASPVDDVFIPDLSNQWQSSRSTFFFFTPDKTGVNESNFTGGENSDVVNANLTGKFKNYDVQFIFSSGDDSGVTYTGKFVKGSKPLQMQVKGTNGVTLTLTRVLNN